MTQYLPILTLFVLAVLFAALSFLASSLLGPKRSTPAKEAPYECGIVPSREAAERFPVRFYLVAMIFIIFDIEIIFLYPWAVVYQRDLQLFGLVEDLNTLPLRARLAKQLIHLVRSYGVPNLADGSQMRIGLHLAQEELAQLLGASRQRVNQELKAMEREEAIRIESGGLVVLDRAALMRISEADDQ